MLMSIPVISPIDITLTGPGIRMLPPPDYEIHALPASTLTEPVIRESTILESTSSTSTDAAAATAAMNALNEIERAAQVSEYHDFSWWDERIRTIRVRLEQVL
jgi:hypothetical protein